MEIGYPFIYNILWVFTPFPSYWSNVISNIPGESKKSLHSVCVNIIKTIEQNLTYHTSTEASSNSPSYGSEELFKNVNTSAKFRFLCEKLGLLSTLIVS